eukprot:sb/3474140/
MIRGSQSRVLDDMRHDSGMVSIAFHPFDPIPSLCRSVEKPDWKEVAALKDYKYNGQGGQEDILNRDFSHSVKSYGYLSFSVFLFLGESGLKKERPPPPPPSNPVSLPRPTICKKRPRAAYIYLLGKLRNLFPRSSTVFLFR